jgi:hypothetical protein
VVVSDWEVKFESEKNPIIVDHSKQLCAGLEFNESLQLGFERKQDRIHNRVLPNKKSERGWSLTCPNTCYQSSHDGLLLASKPLLNFTHKL